MLKKKKKKKKRRETEIPYIMEDSHIRFQLSFFFLAKPCSFEGFLYSFLFNCVVAQKPTDHSSQFNDKGSFPLLETPPFGTSCSPSPSAAAHSIFTPNRRSRLGVVPPEPPLLIPMEEPSLFTTIPSPFRIL